MEALGGTKNKTTEEENDENVRHLEITEVVLVHFNILTTIIKKIQEYTFVPSKSFGQLLDISPNNSIFLKVFDSEFSYG